MQPRRWWVAALRRRWRALALLAAAAAALGVRLPAHYSATAVFPHTQPHLLVDLFADFSHQPDIGTWSVVEDHSNFTTWQYAVQYECGARCRGAARVRAHSEPLGAAPAHGPAARHHHVRADLRACTHLPLLAWPRFCDEMETLAYMTSDTQSGGAALSTTWSARCPALSALSGACGARLRAHHDALLTRVRAALAVPLARG